MTLKRSVRSIVVLVVGLVHQLRAHETRRLVALLLLLLMMEMMKMLAERKIAGKCLMIRLTIIVVMAGR